MNLYAFLMLYLVYITYSDGSRGDFVRKKFQELFKKQPADPNRPYNRVQRNHHSRYTSVIKAVIKALKRNRYADNRQPPTTKSPLRFELNPKNIVLARPTNKLTVDEQVQEFSELLKRRVIKRTRCTINDDCEKNECCLFKDKNKKKGYCQKHPPSLNQFCSKKSTQCQCTPPPNDPAYPEMTCKMHSSGRERCLKTTDPEATDPNFQKNIRHARQSVRGSKDEHEPVRNQQTQTTKR